MSDPQSQPDPLPAMGAESLPVVATTYTMEAIAPGRRQVITRADVYASLPAGTKLTLLSDAQQIIDRLTRELEDYRAAMPKMIHALSEAFKERDAALKAGYKHGAWAAAPVDQGGERDAARLVAPVGLSHSDAQFWLTKRSAILQAISDEGFTLVSTVQGCRLMKLGKITAAMAQSKIETTGSDGQ